MQIEEAIAQALTYETRIRDLYREAAEQTSDPKGVRVFEALAADEQRHIDYLEHKQRQWRAEGLVTAEPLASALPPVTQFKAAISGLQSRLAGEDLGDEKRMLSKALQVEVETSAFYRRMTETMTGEARAMFARIQEIEDGHVAIVQAELDYISHNGFWFDLQEFDMEY
ncbi:MAG: ferritin family protein [Desulfobacterales bacterium]|nr:ferritin family protein [Desulfobacterales bacterium]